MSRKKQNKFRITARLCCNADGTEKYPMFFIRKSKQPQCFKKQTPLSLGFYYRNNKMAWMTAKYFEEWVQWLDLKMHAQGRNVALTIDNFSGHSIDYQPHNIELIYFDPNMTPFIQPLDAGIIRCFKAHYQQAFCLHAIDMDEAGEADIYKLNLLEGMYIAQAAWDAVTLETIQHCWNHTHIQPSPQTASIQPFPQSTISSTAPSLSGPSHPTQAPRAWNIVHEFGGGDEMTLL
jgi:hypothetical protein